MLVRAAATSTFKKDLSDNFNLFLLHPSADAEDSLLNQVTKTVSKDMYPIPQDDNTLFYLSDQQGVFNVYRYQIADSLFNQVTNYAVSVQDYDINFDDQLLATIMLSDQKDYVFLMNQFDPSQTQFTPKTQRQEAIQAEEISQRLLERQARTKATDSDDAVPSEASAPSSSEDLRPHRHGGGCGSAWGGRHQRLSV